MEISQSREPWNKGKLIGQKPPLKLKDIWAIRIHLQLGKRIRDLAMFNLAIDSKLRFGKPACPGRYSRQPDVGASDSHSTKDSEASAV